MTQDGSLRIGTSGGAMLADRSSLGNLRAAAVNWDTGGAEQLFESQFWLARGAASATSAGRGAAWFVAGRAADGGEFRWVLRHYRRGGWAAALSADRYVFAGEAAVRAFAEFRLLARLVELDLPAPQPIAARYRRFGLTYRCDLITRRIGGATPLSERLVNGTLTPEIWHAIGSVLRRLHRAGVDHADLNAHNILIDERGVISVIDFDRGRLRSQGAWVTDNLKRLHRSLRKIASSAPSARWSGASWEQLIRGYSAT